MPLQIVIKPAQSTQPTLNGSSRKGDLYVKIIVQLPTKLSRQQIAVMEEYAKLENATTSPKLIPLESLSR